MLFIVLMDVAQLRCASTGNQAIYQLQSERIGSMKKMLWRLSLMAILLLAGCATFEHQTTEAEPHGTVVIKRGPDLPDQPVVERLDGLPVVIGREYRVKPGEHQVIIRMVERGVAVYKGASVGVGQPSIPSPAIVTISESSKPALSGDQLFGGTQPVQFNIEERRFTYVTNSLTVQVGWRYELDGESVAKTRQP